MMLASPLLRQNRSHVVYNLAPVVPMPMLPAESILILSLPLTVVAK